MVSGMPPISNEPVHRKPDRLAWSRPCASQHWLATL